VNVPTTAATVYATLSSLTSSGWKAQNYTFLVNPQPGTQPLQFSGTPLAAVVPSNGHEVLYGYAFSGGDARTITAVRTSGVQLSGLRIAGATATSVVVGYTAPPGTPTSSGGRVSLDSPGGTLTAMVDNDGGADGEGLQVKGVEPQEVTAGGMATLSISGLGFLGGSEEPADVTVAMCLMSQQPLQSGSGCGEPAETTTTSDTGFSIGMNVPTVPGVYCVQVTTNSVPIDWLLDEYSPVSDEFCGVTVDPATTQTNPVVTVTACTPDPATLYQLNLSTGDTNKCLSTVVTPSTLQVQPVFSGNFTLLSYPNSSCAASLAFTNPPEQGTGSVTSNVHVTAETSNCGGIFAGYATAFATTSNSVTVVVPPQALVKQLHAEAYGYSDVPSLDLSQVVQKSVGMTDVNRFGYSSDPNNWFGGVKTFQGLAAQQPQQIAQDGTSNGPPIVIDNAAEVFAGQVTPDPTQSSTCYWSPFNWEMAVISQVPPTSATYPTGLNDPGCFCVKRTDGTKDCSLTQIVWKSSMPLNTGKASKQQAPAFVFERLRSSGQPAVVQIQ
jgi:hypothetical protein